MYKRQKTKELVSNATAAVTGTSARLNLKKFSERNKKMYKWKIDIILNCGKAISGLLICDENNSDKVAEKILVGNLYEYIGIADKTEKANLFIKRGDISAMQISVFE